MTIIRDFGKESKFNWSSRKSCTAVVSYGWYLLWVVSVPYSFNSVSRLYHNKSLISVQEVCKLHIPAKVKQAATVHILYFVFSIIYSLFPISIFFILYSLSIIQYSIFSIQNLVFRIQFLVFSVK